MTDFKVGDEVEIIDDRNYSVTRIGSTGTITKVGFSEVSIKFNTIEGRYQEHVGNTFEINIKHIKLTRPIPKEEKIINKVNLIYSRQRARGIAHV